MLVLAAAGTAALAGVATAVRHRAETAADLAALSAAAAAARGGAACPTAAGVAAANGAAMATCQVEGWTVDVSVHLQPRGPLGALPAAHASARAGPVSLGGAPPDSEP